MAIKMRILYASGKKKMVAFANEIKAKLLGVNEETLAKYGAVSEETAREMAVGVMKLMDADYGIGITGIAGPGGGTPEKPVGLVYVSLADKDGCEVVKLNLRGDREHVRMLSSNNALAMLIRKLNK